MISFIRGQLVEKFPTHVVIENNGIGFEIIIPLSTFQKIGEPQKEVTLLTYLHVREDALTLFGFATAEERELYQDVLSVSGVGPKLALGILSGASVVQIYHWIANSDEDSLVQIRGLGRKTAQRLILDLKSRASDKIKQVAPGPHQPAAVYGEKAKQGILAMLSLGYSKKEAERAIGHALGKIGEDVAVEELIRLALSGE